MNTMMQKKSTSQKNPGFFIRLVAFYIDQLILCLLAPIIVLFLNIFILLGLKDKYAIGFTISLIFTAAYYIILESSPLKGTFGKRILGIRVTQINGDKLSVFQATLRFIYMGLCFLSFGIGFLPIMFRKDKRGIHDILAKAKFYYDNGRNIVVKTIMTVFFSLIATSILITVISVAWIYFHTYDEKDCLSINKIANDVCDYSLPAQFVPYKGMNYIIVQCAVFEQSSTNERNIISFMKTLSHEMKDSFISIDTNNALQVITKNTTISNQFFNNYKESILFLPDDKIEFMSFVEFKQQKSFYIIEWNSDNTNNINEARTFFESIKIKKY